MKKYHKDGVDFSVVTRKEKTGYLIDTFFIKEGPSGIIIHKSVRYKEGSAPDPKHMEKACEHVIKARNTERQLKNKKDIK